jgi:hypothetical protein
MVIEEIVVEDGRAGKRFANAVINRVRLTIHSAYVMIQIEVNIQHGRG